MSVGIERQPLPPGTARGVAPDTGASKSWWWPTQHAGSDNKCTMDNAVLTIRADGSVTFSANTSTTGPEWAQGNDVYILWLTVRDGSRNVIMNLPEMDGPQMNTSHHPFSWNTNVGQFDVLRTRFNDLQIIDGTQHC